MKRLLALVVCSLLVSVTAFAEDPKLVMKVGSVAPEGTPWSDWLDGVKARLEKDSGGRVKLKLFLGGKLGGEKEMAEETRNGNLGMFGGSAGALATYVPELAGIELPYLYASDAEADYVLDKIRPQVSKLLEAKGFVMVMWGENGWHGYGIKGKCVEKPDDMKGLKMRAQESYVHMETYKAFGAAPVEMSTPEVLGALQTGTVDGYSNSPLLSQATSWYKGVTHYTYTKHIYQPALIVISKKVYDGLTPDLQKIVVGDSKAQAIEGRVGVRALQEPLLENFTAAKVQVCRLSAAERNEFAKLAPAVHKTYIEGEGKPAAAMYAKAQKALEAYRKKK